MAKKTEAERPEAPAITRDPTTLWSPEDMARMDNQITELAQIVSRFKEQCDNIEARFVRVEHLLSRIDLGENLLPAEIAAGIEPSQLYMGAMQAIIIGLMISNPTGILNPTGRESAFKRAADYTEQVVNTFMRRAQLKPKKE